jgi:hypothetical protein
MERVKFSNCLNKEIRFWNIPLGSLIGGGIIGGSCWMTKGIFWFFGGGAAGFLLGGWLMRQWWLGNVQRYLYWNLPSWLITGNKNIPDSSMRNLM